MAHSLVEGKQLSKHYGSQVVLDDLSFLITEKQKVALIGRNGAGKSTLLRILTGAEMPDTGNVTFYPQASVGIVEQHEILPGDITTQEYLEKKSEKPEWEIKKQAAQFGLHADQLAMPPAKLSGGYQMRVKLVSMLLLDPNVLLLDEPINYLDLQSQLLLERFLNRYSGSFLMAAHDRTFLQNTCTHTFEIERGKLTSYKGGVHEYESFKKEQLAYELRNNKKLSKEIAHQQAFVDRFRSKATMASRAQSKVKHIEKLRRKIADVDTALATTRMTIPCPHVVSGTAVHADELAIGYEGKAIASDIRFEIYRGEKVVIAGENGQGKSTLMKTLAGHIPAVSGSFKWWHKANIGYFDQHTEKTLHKQETVLQYLSRMAPPSASSERILMMAGNFLFRNDDLDKSTSVLSGGERARLCLAGILLHEHSVLLLDEPTNHLDVETVEALALALKAYDGTVIVISHSRTFVHTFIDRIFEIGYGKLRQHLGTYEEYIDDVRALMEASVQDELQAPKVTGTLPATERAAIHKAIKLHQRSKKKLEDAIGKLESEKDEILAFLFDNPEDYAPRKYERIGEIDTALEKAEKDWLIDAEQIVELRAKLA
ncbi:MAG: ABC-F family ATP-binding cassette domain-containing protein [Candidatus Magasanikbacteria bacterium]|jgi:ATP-binding cassette, subfamily F, member 3|nr:ABC-F family ATP-binding cassette domain-containing protein [Candidatus Magasanikbacteria bacterium]